MKGETGGGRGKGKRWGERRGTNAAWTRAEGGCGRGSGDRASKMEGRRCNPTLRPARRYRREPS
eukprot:scaffold170030_cov28-Tisochrysis_lutea.AAC.5